MRRVVLLAAVAVAVLLACSGVVPAQIAAPASSQSESPKKTPKNKVQGSYIVVLKDTEDPEQVAQKKEQRHDLKIKHVYENALKGFSAEIPEDQVEEVRNNPEVEYVEQDSVVRALDQTLPWGIDKIGADLSSTKAGNGSDSVSNVNAYIIDTGIYREHPDLDVVGHVNFAGDGKNRDCDGHGTHVAGTVAAKDDTGYVVGAAPGASLTGVKVLGCNGSGTTSRVIKGIDWVTANADVDGPDNILGTSDDNEPAVANMSLGGGASKALDKAVRRSARSGIFYAVAAGNDGKNACRYSPARAGRTKNSDGTWNKNNGVMTVAATDSSDKETSWSNHGSCVDLWAPGVSILSTRKGGGMTTMSGTSMASPHGAGGGALYLSTHTTDSPSVEIAVKSAATTTANKSKDGRTITRENVSTF